MIDKLMEKRGFTVVEENKYGVTYKRREPQNFNQIVCIMHKHNGEHLMQSYDEKVIDGRNEACGVEIPVLLLMWLKAKYMKFKYHWN